MTRAIKPRVSSEERGFVGGGAWCTTSALRLPSSVSRAQPDASRGEAGGVQIESGAIAVEILRLMTPS